MKVYQCDVCGKVIEDPYEEKMKEFFVGCHSDYCGVFPENSKRKIKVHLCDDCFKGLHLIAEKKRNSKAVSGAAKNWSSDNDGKKFKTKGIVNCSLRFKDGGHIFCARIEEVLSELSTVLRGMSGSDYVSNNFKATIEISPSFDGMGLEIKVKV